MTEFRKEYKALGEDVAPEKASRLRCMYYMDGKYQRLKFNSPACRLMRSDPKSICGGGVCGRILVRGKHEDNS
jgi:hypothetical protein